jgi:hypothetical protein
LFKTGLTATIYENFLDSYQSFETKKSSSNTPFVYVDENGIKIITDIVNESDNSADGVFAVSVAEDGWMEFLALYEN